MDAEKVQEARLRASEQLLCELRVRHEDGAATATSNDKADTLVKRLAVIEAAKATAETELEQVRSSLRRVEADAKASFEQAQQCVLGAVVSREEDKKSPELDAELLELRHECGSLRGTVWAAERDKAGLARQLSATLEDLAAMRSELAFLKARRQQGVAAGGTRPQERASLGQSAGSAEADIAGRVPPVLGQAPHPPALAQAKGAASAAEEAMAGSLQAAAATPSQRTKAWRPTRSDWKQSAGPTIAPSALRQERMSEVAETTKAVSASERAEAVQRMLAQSDSLLSQAPGSDATMDWKAEFGRLAGAMQALEHDLVDLEGRLEAKAAECEQAVLANAKLVADLAAARQALADEQVASAVAALERAALAKKSIADGGSQAPPLGRVDPTELPSRSGVGVDIGGDSAAQPALATVERLEPPARDVRERERGPAEPDVGALADPAEVRRKALRAAPRPVGGADLGGLPGPVRALPDAVGNAAAASATARSRNPWRTLAAASFLSAAGVAALLFFPALPAVGPPPPVSRPATRLAAGPASWLGAGRAGGLRQVGPATECREDSGRGRSAVVSLQRELERSRAETAALEARLHGAALALMRR